MPVFQFCLNWQFRCRHLFVSNLVRHSRLSIALISHRQRGKFNVENHAYCFGPGAATSTSIAAFDRERTQTSATMLQYDDNGFYFFLLSSLSFYLIPCKSSPVRLIVVAGSSSIIEEIKVGHGPRSCTALGPCSPAGALYDLISMVGP